MRNGPHVPRRRRGLRLAALLVAAPAFGCDPSDTGTVSVPKEVVNAAPPAETTRPGKKAPPGPAYERIPRGPGQIQKPPQ